MRKLLLIIVALATFLNSKSQDLSGEMNIGIQNLSLKVDIFQSTNTVRLTLTGPQNRYFAFGFNQTRMSNTYTILSRGTNIVEERKLGNHSSGTTITNSITIISNQVNNGVRTIVLERPITGISSNHFTFPTSPSGFSIIWAYGNSTSFSYHAGRGVSSISLKQNVNCPETPPRNILPITQICEGESTLIFGISRNTAGIYYDTVKTSNNCDSILEQELIINPAYTVQLNENIICEGDSAFIFGVYRKTAGTYFNTLSSINGCDSIITQELIVSPVFHTSFDTVKICNGDSVLFADQYRKTTGVYTDLLTSVSGCDSTVQLPILVIEDRFENLPDIILCEGDSALVFGKHIKNEGTYHDTTFDGNKFCKLYKRQQVIAIKNDSTLLPLANICSGDSILFNNAFLKQSGLYTAILTNNQGCDSIVLQEVIVTPNYHTSLTDLSVCAADSVLIFGVYRNTAGIYSDSLKSIEGCDSIITQKLTLNPVFNHILDTAKICNGDSIFFANQWRKTSGLFTDSFISVNGCDSTIQLPLLLLQDRFEILPELRVCQGDSVLVFGNYQYTEGIYTDTIFDGNQFCKLIITQRIVEEKRDSTFLNPVAICEGDSTIFQNLNIKESGLYSKTFSNSNGCDSTVFLQVTVNPNYHITLPNISICDIDSALIFGEYRRTSGTYSSSFQSIHGCDSLVEVSLFVNENVNYTLPPIQICEGDSALIFSKFRKSSANYTDTIKGQNNECDTVYSQELKVLPSYFEIAALITSCEGDTIQINGNNYSKDTTIVLDLKSIHGCDSTVVQELVFYKNDYTLLPNIILCEGDTAYINNTPYYQDSTVLINYFNQNGCDSIVEQTIEIHAIDSVVLSDMVICEGDSVFINNEYIKNEGIYSFTNIGSNGCDSISTVEVILSSIELDAYTTDSSIICDNLGSNFKWYNCNNDSFVLMEGNEFTPDSSGSYKVKFDYNNCSFVSDCIEFNVVSTLEHKPTEVDVQIYPNPATDQINISLNKSTFLKSIKIINTIGQTVESQLINAHIDYIRLNTTRLFPGLYIIHIESTESTYKNQIMIY